MAFNQFKLDLATFQTRDIFNNYVYETQDSVADTQSEGYFAASRFANQTPDIWIDSFITCTCSDGIYTGQIDASGNLVPAGSDSYLANLTDGQVPKKDDDTNSLVYGGATVDPDTGEWTFDDTINVPGASVKIGLNITLSDFGESLAIFNDSTAEDKLAVAQLVDPDKGIVDPDAGMSPPAQDLSVSVGDAEISDAYTETEPLAFIVDPDLFIESAPAEEFIVVSNRFEFETVPPSGKILAEVWIGTDDTGEKIFEEEFDVQVGTVIFTPRSPQTFRKGVQYYATDKPVDGGSFKLRGETVVPFGFIPAGELNGYSIRRVNMTDEENVRDQLGVSSYIYANSAYTDPTAATAGIVSNYEPTSTADTVTGGEFNSGVDATSNPTVVTDGSDTFAQGDIIQVYGTRENDGIYEAEDHTGTLLTIRGIGTVDTVEDFTDRDFIFDIDDATITKINVSVLRSGTDGLWEEGKGSETGIVFQDVNQAAPGGNDTEVQFNDGGVLNGDPEFTWDKSGNVLTVGGDSHISGSLGVGTDTPAYPIDVVGATNLVPMRLADETGDSTSKSGGFATRHYLNAEEDVIGVLVDANVSENTIFYGGGSASFNSATEHEFYTSATNATVSGTLRFKIEDELVSCNADLTVENGTNTVLRINSGAAGQATINLESDDIQKGIIGYDDSNERIVISHDEAGTNKSDIDALTVKGGSVGIGTVAPVSELEVVGDITVSNDSKINFSGTDGGFDGVGITYEDSGGVQRQALEFVGSDLVSLVNHAANGITEIHANTAVAGTDGCTPVIRVAFDEVTFFPDGGTNTIDMTADLTVSGTITSETRDVTTNPSTIVDIHSSSDIDDLATAGVITVTDKLTLKMKASVTSDVEFVMSGSGTLVITADFNADIDYIYDGAGTFISGTTSGDVAINAAVKLNGSGTGTLLSLVAANMVLTDAFVIAWDDLGSFSNGFLLADNTAFVAWSTGINVSNASMAISGALLNNSTPSGEPFLSYASNIANSTVTINQMTGTILPTESLVKIDPNIPESARVIIRGCSLLGGGDLFKTPDNADIIIDSMLDEADVVEALTAMADNGAGGTTFTAASHGFIDGDTVTITATTNYNGTDKAFNVTTNTFDLPFTFTVDDATGTATSERFDIVVPTGHGLLAGDPIKIITSDHNNGFNTVLVNDTATNLDINGIFVDAGTGLVQSGDISLDETDPKVLASDNLGFKDSKSLPGIHIEENPTETTVSVADTYQDVDLSGSSGAIASAANNGSGGTTMTDVAHGLVENQNIKIYLMDNYNGEYTIFNVTTDTFDINSTFDATDTGSWTSQVTPTSNSERFRLINEINGEQEYLGLEEYNENLIINIAALKTGSSENYLFTVAVNGSIVEHSPFVKRTITTDSGNLTLVTPITLNTGDTFKLQLAGVGTTNNLTVESISLG